MSWVYVSANSDDRIRQSIAKFKAGGIPILVSDKYSFYANPHGDHLRSFSLKCQDFGVQMKEVQDSQVPGTRFESPCGLEFVDRDYAHQHNASCKSCASLRPARRKPELVTVMRAGKNGDTSLAAIIQALKAYSADLLEKASVLEKAAANLEGAYAIILQRQAIEKEFQERLAGIKLAIPQLTKES